MVQYAVCLRYFIFHLSQTFSYIEFLRVSRAFETSLFHLWNSLNVRGETCISHRFFVFLIICIVLTLHHRS